MKKLAKLAAAVISLTILGSIALGCSYKWQDGKVKVMTSLFPYYDIARTIGGDYADVKMLLKPGADSHGYEPTARQIANIQDADVFIYTGKMESWAERVVGTLNQSVRVLDVAESIEEHGHDHDHDDSENEGMGATGGDNYAMPLNADHDHEGEDPHIWLSVDNMVIAAEAIEEMLVAADGQNEQYYRSNTKALIEELIELDEEFRHGIENAGKTKLVFTGHFAYGLLLEEYGIDNYIKLYEGVTEDEEAKIGNRAEIERVLNSTDESVRHLFYDYYDAKPVAKQIANDVKKKNPDKGIELLKLHTLENLSKQDFADGKTYIVLMRENLTNLIKGLNG